MKKISVLILAMFLIFSLTACNTTKTNSVSVDSSIVSSSFADTQTSVVVSTENFPENTIIQIQTVKDDTRVKDILSDARSVEIYDIKAVLNNENVQPSAAVEVTFPLPSDYDSDKHNIKVYYISDKGTTEKIDASVVEGKVVAKLSHFSVYAVAVVEKLLFNLAVNANATAKDGQKFFVSDTNLTFEFEENDNWITFTQRNKNSGLSVEKDFYGKNDTVYYTVNGVKYDVLKANSYVIEPTDLIEANADYACITAHRESIQTEWFYDIKKDEVFDKSAKRLIIDTKTNTFTIKRIAYTKLSANTSTSEEEILETGTYTSNDGDTLGATLTLSNGYVLTTSRSNSHMASLTMNGKTITVKTLNLTNFYD